MTTTQQPTTTSVNDILQFATDPDTSLAERTKLHEENRRVLAGRIKEMMDEVETNDTMLADKNSDGLKQLHARLNPKQPVQQPSGRNWFVIVGLVIGLVLGAIIANVWGEYAAPHVKGSSLDLGAVLIILAGVTVLGGFFGSLLNDRRTK